MADRNPPLPPPSKPFPGSRTPGWNDPPTLQYDPQSPSTRERPRLNLNKRVAFPLQGMGGEPGVKPTAIVQPNQSGTPPLPSLPPTAALVGTNSIHPIAVVHPMSHMNVAPSFMSTVHTVPERLIYGALTADEVTSSINWLRDQLSKTPEVLNGRRSDIERRFTIMEQLLRTGGLSLDVQHKIYKIASAVGSNDPNEAMRIFRALSANHSDECSAWIFALRHIVLTIRAMSKQSSIGPRGRATDASSTSLVSVIPYGPNVDNETFIAASHTQVDNNTQSAVQHI